MSVLADLEKGKKWNDATRGLGSIPRVLSPEETRVFVEKQYLVFQGVAGRLNMAIR